MAKKVGKKTGGSSLFWIALSVLLIISIVMAILGFLYQKNNQAPQKASIVVERPLKETETPAVSPQTVPLISNDQDKATSLTSDQTQSYPARLFFVQAVDDGRLSLKSVQETVYYSNNQLLEASIKTLLKGPPPNAQNKNFITLIPAETELLSAIIKDGVAYLNFNEAIRFNSFGIDGSYAEIKQIVYTATEFNEVEKVQFLIDGQEVDYFAEGINIKEPLTRNQLF